MARYLLQCLGLIVVVSLLTLHGFGQSSLDALPHGKSQSLTDRGGSPSSLTTRHNARLDGNVADSSPATHHPSPSLQSDDLPTTSGTMRPDLNRIARLRVIDLPRLSEELHDPDPKMRAQALETWAQHPDASLDAITYALADPDETVRSITQALIEHRLEDVEALRDSDPTVRIHALDTWAQHPGPSLNPVTYALVDPDESVRARAQELFEQELERR